MTPEPVSVICPYCGEEAPDDAKWCEACGQDLNSEPLPACVACGEREVAEEGYCLSCGHKQPEERDHMEFVDGSAVAVTDRGRRHRHNEDAVAIGSIPGGPSVLVVCDGVSTTSGSAEASLRAATAARDLLISGLGGTPNGSPAADPVAADPTPGVPIEGEPAAIEPDLTEPAPPAPIVPDPPAPQPTGADRSEAASPPPPSPTGADVESTGPDRPPPSPDGASAGADPSLDGSTAPSAGDDPATDPASLDTSTLLLSAVEAAQAEAAASADIAVEAPSPSAGGPPSSTLVAVIVRPTESGAELATAWVGDSRAYWVGEQPRRLTPADHEVAGSLVRWLGADSLDPTPDIELTTVTGPGHVVVCSDGLWRYAQEPGELGELIERLRVEGVHGLDLASAMVDFANEGGGHDNISVALWTNTQPPDPPPDTPQENPR